MHQLLDPSANRSVLGGIAMGGGIGVISGASYHVVTENTLMVMPIAIEFSLMSANHFLDGMPKPHGMFLD